MIISTFGLRRDFAVGSRLRRRRVTAVADVTLTVAPGEAVGFLGPNGAGKSTTIKMLTGVLVPTAGRAVVCGFDPVRQRRELARRIGVVFGQRSQLWWDLPLVQSFELHAAIHRVPAARYRERLDECVQLLDMSPFLATPVRQLSLGQRMRGEVTAALLHAPELLVLDELTALRARFAGNRALVVELTEPAPPLHGLPGVVGVAVEAQGLRQRLEFTPATTAAALIAALAGRVPLHDVTIAEPTIEDMVRTLYATDRAAPG